MKISVGQGLVVGVLVLLLLVDSWRIFDLAQEREALQQAGANLCDELKLIQQLSIDLGGRRTRSEIKTVLASRYRTEVVKDDGEVTWVGPVGLRFVGDVLVEIVSMNARFDCPKSTDETQSQSSLR